MTLAAWITSNGLSQAAAGAVLGVPSGTVCRWLRGLRTPSVTTALDIEKRTAGAVPVEAWTATERRSARRSTRRRKNSRAA